MYIYKWSVFMVEIISWKCSRRLDRADMYCSSGTLVLLPTREKAYWPRAVLDGRILCKKKRLSRNVTLYH